METDEQTINSKPWLFKKGQSGNPKGRTPGTLWLKEYARKYIMNLSDEEKEEFMDWLPKEVIWKMAEWNPATQTDLTSGGKPIPIIDIHALRSNDSNKENSKAK